MKTIVAATLFALAAGAAHGAPATEGRTSAAQQKIPGVSDEGNAIAQKARAASLPELGPLIRGQIDTRGAIAAQINGDTIDLKEIERLMRQQEKLAAEARAVSNTTILTAAKAMTEEDRKAFLRALLGPAAQPAAPVQR